LQYNGVKQQHLRYTATATAKATAAAAETGTKRTPLAGLKNVCDS